MPLFFFIILRYVQVLFFCVIARPIGRSNPFRLLCYARNDKKLVHSVILGSLLIFFSGCASFEDVSYHSIKNKLPLLDLSNGVNDQEAIVLAQNFIISKGLGDRLYTLKPIGTEKKNFWKSDQGRIEFYIPPGDDFKYEVEEYWMVMFRDREGSQFFGHYPVIPFYVKVDAKSGDVIRWGLKTDEVR